MSKVMNEFIPRNDLASELMPTEDTGDYPLHPEMYALMYRDARQTLRALGAIIVLFPTVTIFVVLLFLSIELLWVALLVFGVTGLAFGFVSLFIAPRMRDAKRGEEVARLNWEQDPDGARRSFMHYMHDGQLQRTNFVEGELRKKMKRESLICLGIAALGGLLVFLLMPPGEEAFKVAFGLSVVLFGCIYGPWYLVRGQLARVSSRVSRAEKEKRFVIKALDELSDMEGLKGELSVFAHEERGALSAKA